MHGHTLRRAKRSLALIARVVKRHAFRLTDCLPVNVSHVARETRSVRVQLAAHRAPMIAGLRARLGCLGRSRTRDLAPVSAQSLAEIIERFPMLGAYVDLPR